jgi:putative flavoprotein involved in K+ transport
LDKETLGGLSQAGFRLNKGEDGNNWQMMYLTRGGGYYFNVGCSELISQKKISLIQANDIDRYEANGLRLKSGDFLEADLVVTAKGYLGQSAMVEKLFGKSLAEKVGPVWGVDEQTQELCNMWNPTPQQGLWFHAGSFAQCRIFSKYLALHIQACELGLATH